jgi:UDP-GlcNAc:undecaprenyl-phosphate GlcNAc-1-phosphate transferase
VLTPLVRGAALGAGLVRQAQADRWHKRPTPAIGGVASFLGFGLAVAVGYLLLPEPGLLSARAPRAVLPGPARDGLLAAGTLVFLVGLLDDLVALKPLQKLAGQIAAAAVLVLSGIGVWATGSYLVDVTLSILWFVAMTNAMNLLDNMDGLAGGIAAIAAAYVAILFWIEGEPRQVMVALALAGSLVGFLAHNYPPARIFMGDSGSLFLGLFLAGLSLSPAPGLSRSLFAVVAIPALILAIPILDTTLVTVGRVLEGRPISQGGKDHTSHRLVALGVSEERAVWVLWSLAILGGAVALLLRSAERATAYLLGGVLLVGLVLVGAYLLSVRCRKLASHEIAKVPLSRGLLTLHGRFAVVPFGLDAGLVALAYYGAYLVRWDPADLSRELPYFQFSVLVVVVAKLLALVLGGIYGPRWHQFSVDDGLRVARASLLGTLVAAASLLLLGALGLSRGVMVIDFMLCTTLIMGSRLVFRFLEGAPRRWSREGTPVVVLGAVDEADLALRQLRRLAAPRLRPVAVADPAVPRVRGRMGAYPLYGGPAALANALHDSRATAVVLIGEGGDGGPTTEEGIPVLEAYLESQGAVDVFRLRVSVERGGTASPVTG